MALIHDLIKAFIPMFVAVDLIGVVPFFMSVSEDMPPRMRARLVRQSVATASLIAIVFVFVGKALFAYMGISISDFMIAGGAVLFVLSVHDLISHEKARVTPDISMGVVPLGTPLMAGPAVLATAVILIGNYGTLATLISIVVNFLLAGLAFHYSQIIVKVLGRNGARAFSKIMQLVLAAYGIMMIRQGIVNLIHNFS
jgi:multiple antibiotic resistance protein